MESNTTRWVNWCRLCAKEDAENNVNNNFRAIHQPLPMGGYNKLTLKEALEKYLCVQSSYDDSMPKYLCIDCYAFISSIISFHERVHHVQQMYKYLMEHSLYDPNELQSVRQKFMVCENLNYHQQNGISVNFTHNKNSPNEQGSIRFIPLIKQESCETESLHSNFKETCVMGESLEPIEELYDEAPVVNNAQESEEDVSFDVKFEIDNIKIDSSSSVDKTVTKPSRSSSSSSENTKVGTEIKVTKSKDKKKKKILEDFALDVNCIECEKNFNQYSVFCQHLKENHGYKNIDKNWQCPLCKRTFQPGYNFKRHMLIHIPFESREAIKCSECEKSYSTIAKLEAHINYKHRNKSFICEECGICVRTNSNLKEHMLTHTDNTPFECEICEKRFKNKARLKNHFDTHGPSKHVCTICKQELNSRITLMRHYLVHSDVMKHKCDYCGRAFKRSKTLKAHLLLHTGFKAYSCDFCERTFTNGSNCRSHMKKMHPVELAALEASGARAHAKNIPKLENLKAL